MALCSAAWRSYKRRQRRKASLSRFGRDMTATARKGDPVVGRDDEIDSVIRILCRRTKNCAALVGAPGVGKTAIAEGLAQRVAAGTVPAPPLGRASWSLTSRAWCPGQSGAACSRSA
ncbi:hypothetical protein ZWY2020_054953 [Hordeum vulgare]|nr:hypothetical protein ZWY2020_054953 [Hordeum vulgare]